MKFARYRCLGASTCRAPAGAHTGSIARLPAALLVAVCAVGSVNAEAKCDAQKAARNAAMDAAVGVSGRCDAEKLAKDKTDDVKDRADLDLDKKNKDRKHDREDRRDERKGGGD